MRKLLIGLVIGLGLVIGFGFGSDINAYDNYAEMTDEEFAMHVRDTHIERDFCTEEHTVCVECDGYFCDNLTCWCGEEIARRMRFEEFCDFEDYIYDLYCEEYCINECNDCDSYYYVECMCDSCERGNDCYECMHTDYEIFIEDYYDMIMDEYYEILRGIIEAETNEEIEMIVCEF